MIRILFALGFGGIVMVFAGFVVNPKCVIPKSKISLSLWIIAPYSLELPFGARLFPLAIDYCDFIASSFTHN